MVFQVYVPNVHLFSDVHYKKYVVFDIFSMTTGHNVIISSGL
jgi:hypothetical protein